MLLRLGALEGDLKDTKVKEKERCREICVSQSPRL